MMTPNNRPGVTPNSRPAVMPTNRTQPAPGSRPQVLPGGKILMRPGNNVQKGADASVLIKRIFIKTVDDDDSSREFQVFSETVKGARNLIGKYRRKEEAIDQARKLARQHNVRFNGEDA